VTTLARRLPAVLIAVAVCACGGEEKRAAPAAAGCEQGSGNTVNVCMKEVEYVPKSVTVPVGGKVVWTNTDQVPHTVTKDRGPGEDFDSKTMPAGTGKFERTFPDAGTVDYICTIHPNQLGKVIVE